MENLLTINIIKDDDGGKAIEILYNGYNIIQETIYNDELAEQVLQLINENRQTDPNKKLFSYK